MWSTTNRKLLLKAFVIYALAVVFIFLLASCDKYVTPGKVERKITKNSWAIATFEFMDTTVANQFANLSFGFGETGELRVVEDNNASGHWSVSESKKPTLLFISAFVDTPYVFLNDDWEVTTVNKDKITLESDNGLYTNSIGMTRIEP